MRYVNILCFRQCLVFGAQSLENRWWDHCYLKKQLLQKFIQGLDSIYCSAGQERRECLFRQDGAKANIAETRIAFLHDVGRGL
jgi:hypothetical protein